MRGKVRFTHAWVHKPPDAIANGRFKPPKSKRLQRDLWLLLRKVALRGRSLLGEMPMGGQSIGDLPTCAMEMSVASGPCTNVRQTLILIMSNQHCLQGTLRTSMPHPGLAWGFPAARALVTPPGWRCPLEHRSVLLPPCLWARY